MPTNPHQPKVFISYAREDAETAQKVARELTLRGIEVWLDSRELLPGENWEIRIAKAIRASDFLVSIISEHSSRKVGYVQSELRQALNWQQQHPSEAVYLIPLLIGDTEIPHIIKDLQVARVTEDVSSPVAQIALSIRKAWAPEQQRREFAATLEACRKWLLETPDQLARLREYYPNRSQHFSVPDIPDYDKCEKLISRKLLASDGESRMQWGIGWSEFDYTVFITPFGVQVVDSLRDHG